MRLEKTDIRSQPLQQIEHLHQQKMVNGLDREELEDTIDKDEMETVVDKMNEFIEPLRTNLKFELHEDLNEYYVTIVNPLTNETIKEIPPKKMLDAHAEMLGFMGILVDEKA